MLLTKDQLSVAKQGSYVRLVEMYEQLLKNPEANKTKIEKAGAAILKSIGQDEPVALSDDKLREEEVDKELERRCSPLVEQYNNGDITAQQLIEGYRGITEQVLKVGETLEREVSDTRLRTLRQLRSKGKFIEFHSSRLQRDMAVITHESQRDMVDKDAQVWHVDEIIKFATDVTPNNRIDLEAIISTAKEAMDGELV